MADSIKNYMKEGAQAVVENAPTVLGASALAVPHPGTKAVLSASSVLVGVAQDLENGDFNNTTGTIIGLGTQKILEKIPATKDIAQGVGFGVSEYTGRVVLGGEIDE